MKEFKKGDKVVIIHCNSHEDYVKEHYGKVLEVEGVNKADAGFYKIKGVKNYAKASDLHLALPFLTEKFYANPNYTLDILNKLNTSKFVKERDMYSKGEFLIFEVLRNEETEKIISNVISDLDAYSEQNKKDFTYNGNELDFSLLVEEYKSVFDSDYEIMWDAENDDFCFAMALWEDEE